MGKYPTPAPTPRPFPKPIIEVLDGDDLHVEATKEDNYVDAGATCYDLIDATSTARYVCPATLSTLPCLVPTTSSTTARTARANPPTLPLVPCTWRTTRARGARSRPARRRLRHRSRTRIL